MIPATSHSGERDIHESCANTSASLRRERDSSTGSHVRRIAIHQPNYAPWIGYFSKMATADTFIFLDDCRMPLGRSYVSRVRVRERTTSRWLTVPIQRRAGELVGDVRFADRAWPRKHLATMRANYGRCPFFDSVMAIIAPIYHDPGDRLAHFNIRLIQALGKFVGITPEFRLASELACAYTGTQRLVDIVQRVGGTVYVSGAGGAKYQEPAMFESAHIQLEMRRYHPVPYRQQGAPFTAGLSILDALFNVGPAARHVLRYDPVAPPLPTPGEPRQA